MAKKRKASRRPAEPAGPKEYDPKDARIGPITSYKDIADEQEQHFIDQDQILFEDEPGSKRQKRQEKEEEFLEESDEEVFARDSDDSADDSDDDDEEYQRLKKTQREFAIHNKNYHRAVARKFEEDLHEDDDEDEGVEKTKKRSGGGDEQDEGWWGSSRNDYYDNEVIETEENAREEEEEARKLQSKQLSRMTASDFFDEDEWANPDEEEGQDKAGAGASGVVKLTMKTAEEIDRLTPEEQYQMLQSLYPEFDYMCDEFAELEPLLVQYKKLAEGKPSRSLEVVQYRVLACYLATMSLYFSLLMAPTRDNPGGSKFLMDPEELHDHEVMQYLVDCRETWAWVKRVQARRTAAADAKDEERAQDLAKGQADLGEIETGSDVGDVDDLPEDMLAELPDLDVLDVMEKFAKKTKKSKKDKEEKKKKDKSAKGLVKTLNTLTKKREKRQALQEYSDDDDDEADDSLGELQHIDARTAEENATRRKSIAFFTSQVQQNESKKGRAAGNSTTGGDMDVPYRERLRDRQARLALEAERRGQRAPKPGEELGGSDDDDDDDEPDAKQNDEEAMAYYDSIVKKNQDKQDVKAARKAAIEAGRLDRVEPALWKDETGRRQLTYQIEKNKGLNHKTIKEKKNNPRVKKRVKFEKKKKQLASMRHVYKEGVDRDNYKGELTGIKTGLVRSIKL